MSATIKFASSRETDRRLAALLVALQARDDALVRQGLLPPREPLVITKGGAA